MTVAMDETKVHAGLSPVLIISGLAQRHSLTAPWLTGLGLWGEQLHQVQGLPCKQMKENTKFK